MEQRTVGYRLSTLPSLPFHRPHTILSRAPSFCIRKKSILSVRVPSSSLRHEGWRFRTRILCTDRRQENSVGPFEGFSVLPQDVPWNASDVWSTMALYFFSLHVPLSFGGLGAICKLLNQPELDPLTKASSILVLQTSELILASTLLCYTVGSWKEISIVFQKQIDTKRSLNASAAGLGVMIFVVLLTSFLADQLVGPKDVNNPILQEILANDPTSKVLCFLAYCLVIPILEEAVYRGFLLTSLASKMKWQQALLISACIFSLAHLSFENAPQLFFIGLVLGSVYCRTGNLLSSILVHSVYNAVILTITTL